MTRISLSPPDVRDLEQLYVEAAIASNWVAPVGPDLDAFETEIAHATGMEVGVGVSSGTAALHLALRELGVSTGDEVFVSTFTFVASVNPITYVGATPVFIDSEDMSWNMCPDLVAEELSARAKIGRLPKAAVVVDLYGQCADYQRLVPIFAQYEIPIIEDAAEALGSRHHEQPAGSFGMLGVVSFNGNKIITTSSGGMLLCRSTSIADHVRFLATQARDPFPYYQHTETGYNYRLSNILAAFGRGQLASLDDRIAKRRRINGEYQAALDDLPGIGFLPIPDWNESNFWLTCITIEPSEVGVTAEDLRIALEQADIESRPVWKPMHLQPLFADAKSVTNGTSEAIFEIGLCLPSGSGMSNIELSKVIDALQAEFRK